MADPQQNNKSGQGYRFSSGHNGSNNSKKGDDKWKEWIAIGILFCIPTGVTQVIAVVWTLYKVGTMLTKQEKQNLRKETRRVVGDVFQGVKNAAGQVKDEVYKAKYGHAPQTGSGDDVIDIDFQYVGAEYASPSSGGKKSRKKSKLKGNGTGLIIGGAVLTALFGLGLIGMTTTFVESLMWGYFFSDELMGVIVTGLLTLGGLIMLGKGIGNNRRKERYLNYLAYIGTNREADLAHMAASFGVSVRKLCRDLRKMLAEGILPAGYLDLAEGKLYLTEMGYRAPEPEVESMTEEQEDDILQQIRQVNDAIPDETMSAKIERIEEITGKILAYQKSHPEKASQLRSFLNYYLPTTLKILRTYAQLDAQGIEGENISAAKARIEGMMDQVVAGFEKQLDKLFQDDAMDITSDVEVLENMLKKDGLSGDDGMTMTM